MFNLWRLSLTHIERTVLQMENEEKTTPMLEQYYSIKKKYEGFILFFRLGDFYEMFDKDAAMVSEELDLVLTSRAGVPMCGVPHHAYMPYLRRLIGNGHKIAICDQMEDPALAKGLVKREVVRIITPGTVIEDGMLDEERNNYIMCLLCRGESCGMVFADISTGEFHLFEKSGTTKSELSRGIIGEIGNYMPSEILMNEEFLDLKEVHSFINERLEHCSGNILNDLDYELENSKALANQFITSNSGVLPSDMKLCVKSVFALFNYINDTYKSEIRRSVKFIVHGGKEYMELNAETRRNLELTETMRGKERKGSLLWVLDKAKTSMGKRRLRQFISQPLMNKEKISARLDAVDEFVSDITALTELREFLGEIKDLERLMSRISYRVASPKDVYQMGKTCSKLPDIKKLLSEFKSPLIKSLNDQISDHTDIANLVANAISEELPVNIKDGGYIKEGFNSELDRLRDIVSGGSDTLKAIEEREKRATGIKNLRVGSNRVFGYYIEVSKGQTGLVPDTYIRRQTLANSERYVTDELKGIESELLSAGEKIEDLETRIFSEVKKFIAERMETVINTAEAIAEIDVYASFARVSVENNYVKPVISSENVINIKQGRHPVVEKILSDVPFTPNDTYLDLDKNRLLVITGPNMAGKSTFMRQTALITLMAQIGCFVPADFAEIGAVDKIYTRVGASDDLSAGRSTFMVEMTEVAEILRGATKQSLVIMDEIGRGTSTFDGISIAKAVAEYINSEKIGCRTLFATHYHELTALEKNDSGIRNLSVAVLKKGDDIQFLHKIVQGSADDSYGIEVAKLAGLPDEVINRAKTALISMESENKTELSAELPPKSEREDSLERKNEQILAEKVKNLDLDGITPREAWKILESLKALF